MRGSYILLVHLPRSISIEVGGLGERFFRAGIYAYVGSAMGKGSSSIEGRLRRHFSKEKRRFWHIDYLLDFCTILEALVFPGSRIECSIASFLSSRYEQVEGFGCSDCSCRSHLFRIGESKDDLRELMKLLEYEFGKPILIEDLESLNDLSE